MYPRWRLLVPVRGDWRTMASGPRMEAGQTAHALIDPEAPRPSTDSGERLLGQSSNGENDHFSRDKHRLISPSRRKTFGSSRQVVRANRRRLCGRDRSWASIGTANLDFRSLFVSHELNLCARSSALAAALKRKFAADLDNCPCRCPASSGLAITLVCPRFVSPRIVGASAHPGPST